jgi:hypothetical protein
MTQAIKSFGARAAGAAVLAATFASNVRAVEGDCSDPNVDPVTQGVNCSQPSGKAGNANLFGGTNSIFQTVANTLIFIVLAVSVIMLIIGGLRYVLSSGEASAVKGAKDTILYAIIGIVVAILAFAIVSFVASRIGASPA